MMNKTEFAKNKKHLVYVYKTRMYTLPHPYNIFITDLIEHLNEAVEEIEVENTKINKLLFADDVYSTHSELSKQTVKSVAINM